MAHDIGTGIITGVVSEDGIAKANAMVCVYDRDTNQLVYRGKCGPTGEYTFTGLNHLTDSYYVMTQDDDGVVKKNALIQDYVQPIDGAVGTQFDANWYIAFKKLNPLNLMAGTEYNKLELTALNMSASSKGFAGGGALAVGSLALSAQATLLGAVNLKKIDVTAGIIKADCPSVQNRYGENTYYTPLGHTVESTLFICSDTAKPFTMVERFSSANYQWSSLSLSSAFLITCLVTNTSQVITLITYTIPAGAGRTGLHSICAVLDSSNGGTTKLYFDGVEVASSIGTLNAKPYATSNITTPSNDGNIYGGLMVTGYYISDLYEPNLAVGTFSFIVASTYINQLSATEVLGLHNSLFLATPAKLTGYRKEVAYDYPQMFYPLCDQVNEVSSEGFVKYNRNRKRFMPDNKLVPAWVTPMYGERTPINGVYGTRFNKSGLFEIDSSNKQSFLNPIGLGPWFYSIELWLKLESVPTEKGYILVTRSAQSDVILSSLSITTARTLDLFAKSVVDNTVSFTPVLTVGDWYHVVITDNRETGVSLLYLNGVLAETKSTGLTALTLAYNVSYGGQGRMTIGGDRTPLMNKANLLDASMVGLAIYQRVLSAARIQAHYDARLIA